MTFRRFALCHLILLLQVSSVLAGRITRDSHCLTIDGHDTFIFSGAFHYFRCPKELWPDRFEKIKAAGFNTVETYIPWNACETQMPARLDDFSKIDLRDAEDWIALAQRYGFFIIIRPGPYICSEWDHGGFPGWLITKRPSNFPADQVWLRSDDPTYLAWVKHWYAAVCPMVGRHQFTRQTKGHGGVILFQLENEYDYSFMSESVKMHTVKALAEDAAQFGIDVPMFTCWTKSVRGNTDPVLSKLFDSCNFYPGLDIDKIGPEIEELRQQQPNAPLATMELQGTFHAYRHARLDSAAAGSAEHFASVQLQNLTLFAWQNGETITNYYMLVGGTNFGDRATQGIAASYNPSAPIHEDGGVGEKYRVVAALGDFLRPYAPKLARSTQSNPLTTTATPDVTAVERRGADGSRFIFVRTSQFSESRSGQASLQESDGKTLAFTYHLGPGGSKILYLPPNTTDPLDGQWFPKIALPIQRPKKLPPPVTITQIQSMPATLPENWKPMQSGQTLPQLGIYDSRFVYYTADLHLSESDLSRHPHLFLKIIHPTSDIVSAQLNGHSLSTIPETGTVYFPTASFLHPGNNHLLLLYENIGFAKIGGAMEKQAGISAIALVDQPITNHPLGNWQMTTIDHPHDPQEQTSIADYKFADWQPAENETLAADQLRPHQWAIFRATLPAGSKGHLFFWRIEDIGWIFINGQFVKHSWSWETPAELDPAPFLRRGSNELSVLVYNNDFIGGLGPVDWSSDQEKTVGKINLLQYASAPVHFDAQNRRWHFSATVPVSINPSPGTSLLTQHILNFDMPGKTNDVWVPWVLHLEATGDGFLYLNGHPLGRYWQFGRQRDFYLPECWLKFGKKNVVELCMEAHGQDHAEISSAQILPVAYDAEWR